MKFPVRSGNYLHDARTRHACIALNTFLESTCLILVGMKIMCGRSRISMNGHGLFLMTELMMTRT